MKADSTDPTTWGTFAEADALLKANPHYPGLGFVFSADDPIVGVDIDNCRDRDGRITHEAEQIARQFATYAEVSPTGTGIHIYGYGYVSGGRRKNSRRGIEMYDKGRFFTVTGHALPLAPATLGPCQDALDALYGELFPEPSPPPPAPLTGQGDEGEERYPDEIVLSLARKAKNGEDFDRLYRGGWEGLGYGSQSEADLALCSKLAFYAGPQSAEQIDRLFRDSGLYRAKWDERRGATTYGGWTVAKALEQKEFYGMGGPTLNLREPQREEAVGDMASGGNTKKGPCLVVKSLAEIAPRPVDWLWNKWLARGKVHILGGHPGDGKSTLTASLAAAFSRGVSWPDESPAPEGRTLFLLAEDAPDDTLRPRLDLHHADVSRISVIEAVRAGGRDGVFNLSKHLDLLEETIVQQGIDLLVIDPLTSFMPSSDRNAEGDVRDLLTPLGKLAERTQVAVLCIMHVGKPTGTNRRPVQQLLGATAFGAVARVVWMVAPLSTQQGENRRVVAVVKSNLAMRPKGLEWSIPGEDQPISWGGESDLDIAELLGGGGHGRPRDAAEEFVRTTLRYGPMPSSELTERAKAAGISETTLRRAFRVVGVTSFKERTKDGAWVTSLNSYEDSHS